MTRDHHMRKFWWTARHIESGNLVTFFSSRSSGSSYLNRVELQNGCLAQGHSNLFIPSTLNGPCYNEETGKIDKDKLQANTESAMDVYISCVIGCPCGDTVTNLFKGADSSEYQSMRSNMQIFLKGSKKKNTRRRALLFIPTFKEYGKSDKGTCWQVSPLSTCFSWSAVSRTITHTQYVKVDNHLQLLTGVLMGQVSVGSLYPYLIWSVHGRWALCRIPSEARVLQSPEVF